MMWTVLGDQKPVARKRHMCSACGRYVEPGETYRRMRVITDDGPGVYKECTHCAAVLAAVWASLGDEASWYMDEGIDLGEWLREYEVEPLASMYARRWAGVAVADLPLDAIKGAATGGTE